jgi:hypothetical protein
MLGGFDWPRFALFSPDAEFGGSDNGAPSGNDNE